MRTFRIAAALGPLALVGLVQAVPVQAADLRVISTIGEIGRAHV